MESRSLGTTGLTVSALGLGTGGLGGSRVDDAGARALLNLALDLGITLVDTAPSYGCAEERIGRHLAGRRDGYVLSTKGGYGVPGIPDWTGEAIRRGIDLALGRLRTDRIDVFHLHSCSLEVLRRDDILDALDRAVRDGKIRVPAYSGENDALAFAVESGRFGVVQASVNLLDRSGLCGPLARAADAGIGVLAKRPLASGAWREPGPDAGPDALEYRRRFLALAAEPGGRWPETAIRYAAFAPGVACAIAGVTNRVHLLHNVRAVVDGPLSADTIRHFEASYPVEGGTWAGVV